MRTKSKVIEIRKMDTNKQSHMLQESSSNPQQKREAKTENKGGKSSRFV